MRIVLVQPAKPGYGTSAEEAWSLARPFSLFFLAAAVEKHGAHEVRIVDLEKREHLGRDPAQALADAPGDLFGITAVTFSRFEAIRVARAVRALYPRAYVLAGGPHFMHCAEDTLRHVPEIDAVAHGEGESTLVAVADALAAGGEVPALPGLTRRAGGGIEPASGAVTFDGFDDLPPYAGFSWDEYPEYLFGVEGRLPAVSVMSSRGCPYRCVFCAKSGTGYRLREPAKVVAEIVALRERLGVSCFNFLDLTFTASPPHVRAVCSALKERAPGIRWWCESRANIPLDLLALMREAGCVSTVIGVESGSPRVLERIGKRISVGQVLAFCAECVRLGIAVQPYFMYSHPGETAENAGETLELVQRLRRMGVAPGGYQPAMIFPGTELERLARATGALPRDFSWCAPYEGGLNLRLGQLPNVPIYRDLLDEGTMAGLQEQFRCQHTLMNAAEEASRLTPGELLRKAASALAGGKPSAAYLVSPRFYRELVRRWVSRGRP